jgi:hypothetical protein
MRRLLAVIVLLSLGSAASAEMYTWKDREGTVFYTNSLHEIPARYLKKARVLDVATGKKGDLVTKLASAQAGTAPPGPAQPSHDFSANAVTAPVAPAPSPAPATPATPALMQQPAPSAPAVAAPQLQPREARAGRRRHRHSGGEEE